MQIYVPTNPRGAEKLAPGIVVQESDLYLRRLWGDPSEVLHITNYHNIIFSSVSTMVFTKKREIKRSYLCGSFSTRRCLHYFYQNFGSGFLLLLL